MSSEMERAIQAEEAMTAIRWITPAVTIGIVAIICSLTAYCTSPSDHTEQLAKLQTDKETKALCIKNGGSWMPVSVDIKHSRDYEMSCITPAALPMAEKMNINPV